MVAHGNIRGLRQEDGSSRPFWATYSGVTLHPNLKGYSFRQLHGGFVATYKLLALAWLCLTVVGIFPTEHLECRLVYHSPRSTLLHVPIRNTISCFCFLFSHPRVSLQIDQGLEEVESCMSVYGGVCMRQQWHFPLRSGVSAGSGAGNQYRCTFETHCFMSTACTVTARAILRQQGHADCSCGATELVVQHGPEEGLPVCGVTRDMCMGSADMVVDLHIFKDRSVKCLSSRRLCE